jgi:quinohemoprotein amine dehydrogenase
MARLGGVAFPKRPEQFEARAFSNGPDGKPNTPDDIEPRHGQCGVDRRGVHRHVPRRRHRFVGQLSESGLFMPNVDGPNLNRSGNRNNVGDVWVVASYLPPGSEPSTKPLRARAHLLVTVPLYLDWSYREVGR